MALLFSQECWACIEQEVVAIASDHWTEIAVHQDKIPLDLDLELFQEMDRNGILHITTARSDGQLVGYYAMVVRTHPNYKSTLFGFLQSFFLLQDFRNTTAGLALFEAMESAMKPLGVKALISGHKGSHNVGPLFTRLGWMPFETMYTKYIGND